jgi:hypothetical protein
VHGAFRDEGLALVSTDCSQVDDCAVAIIAVFGQLDRRRLPVALSFSVLLQTRRLSLAFESEGLVVGIVLEVLVVRASLLLMFWTSVLKSRRRCDSLVVVVKFWYSDCMVFGCLDVIRVLMFGRVVSLVAFVFRCMVHSHCALSWSSKRMRKQTYEAKMLLAV